jgi:TetR/AcrR family transcriptional regulator
MVRLPVKSPTNPGEKESLILDVAHKRFAAYGLNKVTMDEIAADLGMGKASLYYYFATKEELFRRVIEREQSAFLEQAHRMLETNLPASEKLKRYTAQRMEYSRQLINLQILSAQSWLYARPIFRNLFDDFAVEEQKCLTRILREGKKHGEFSLRSSEATSILLLHALQGLRLRMRLASDHQVNGSAGGEAAALEREIDLFMDVFLNGIKAAGTSK